MDINILEAGYCTQIERISNKKGSLKKIKFPASFVLIKHPNIGYILFDTGYSQEVFNQMKFFPYNIYGKITPIYLKQGESAKEQILNMGIHLNEIKFIIISHFHADHIGGCTDFPNAKFICCREDYYEIKDKSGLSALKNAFIPKLLPSNFEKRVLFIEDKKRVVPPIISEIFPYGYDLFDDGQIIAINLPGHTKNQFGIFLKSKDEYYFFIADACWQKEAYEKLQYPSKIAKLIKKDYKEYLNTISKLNAVYNKCSNIKIIATHVKY